MSRVDEILAAVQNVPSAPQVLQRVLSLVNDPDFSFDQLMQVVSLDPGITAAVLRMCNSAYFGLKQPVGSITAGPYLSGGQQHSRRGYEQRGGGFL